MKNKLFAVLISLSALFAACSATPEADSTPPVLTVSSPTNGQITGLVYTIAGTVSDAGSGVAGVSVTVDSGAAVAANVANGLWSATVEVPAVGVHTNAVSAVDASGNRSESVSVVTLAANVPSIVILKPDNGVSTNVRDITFFGSASIGEPYHISLVQISLNGGEWANTEGTVAWFRTLTLNEGTNSFIARVFSSNGKTACSPEWTVFASAPYPEITIISPTNGLVQTNDGSVVLSGTASVESPGFIAAVQYSLNGGEWRDAEGTENWSANLTVKPGYNTITARAIASCGKETVAEPVTVLSRADTVYVSAERGNDTNDGITPLTPILNISNANVFFIKHLYINGNFTLTTNTTSSNAGWYLSGATNLTICGGWNEDFTAQGGASVLNGQTQCKHVVYMHKCSGVTLSNFVLTGGASSTANGGGAALYSTANCVIACIVSNNSARYGGGIYLSGNLNQFSGLLSNNTASRDGGGLYLSGCSSNTVSGLIIANKTSSGYCGGGIYISGNTASGGGGGVYIYYSSYNAVSGTVSGNTAVGRGGGVYIYGGSYNAVSGTVSGNTANQYGGGVFIRDSSYNAVSGTVSGNTTVGGGGICIDNSSFNAVSGTVSGNTATSGGGGIYIYVGSYNTFSGTVSGNTAATNGGGVYIIGTYNTNTGTVSSNTAGSVGGGVYIGRSSNYISGTVTRNTAVYGGGIAIFGGRYSRVAAIVTYNLATEYGGGVFVNFSSNNTFVSASSYRYNHCDNDNNASGLGGGIAVGGSTAGNAMQSGITCTPNYRGSGTGTVDDLYGITAP